MIPFDHPANQIDQVDSEIKDIGIKLMVEEVSSYFLGGDPIYYIGLVHIDPRSRV